MTGRPFRRKTEKHTKEVVVQCLPYGITQITYVKTYLFILFLLYDQAKLES